LSQKTTVAIKMEGAFTHLGNHLISDSAAAINAGDDLSTIDPDESLLYGQYGGVGGLGSSRRRNDDDDNETEVYDDDDVESMASMPIDGMKTLGLRGLEDEKELPAHACA
jgi:regulator of nonsense transcripts 1